MKRLIYIIAGVILISVLVYLVFTSPLVKDTAPGFHVDSLDGVVVFYNGSVSETHGRNMSADGYNIGKKYQCVEFVKRYYYEHFHHKMPDSYGHAKDFFDTGTEDGMINKRRDLLQFTNPSSTKPAKGDLVVFGGTAFNQYGHVAIISEVGSSDVEIIQQNPGPNAPSRVRFDLVEKNGKYSIENSRLLGWLRMKE